MIPFLSTAVTRTATELGDRVRKHLATVLALTTGLVVTIALVGGLADGHQRPIRALEQLLGWLHLPHPHTVMTVHDWLHDPAHHNLIRVIALVGGGVLCATPPIAGGAHLEAPAVAWIAYLTAVEHAGWGTGTIWFLTIPAIVAALYALTTSRTRRRLHTRSGFGDAVLGFAGIALGPTMIALWCLRPLRHAGHPDTRPATT